MGIVDTRSLAATVDAVNEAFFYGQRLAKSERARAAKWIASRQGKPYSYAEMFAPTDKDYLEGFRVFTGERIRSGAATGHILGEEASRALILLDVRDDRVARALNCATEGMMGRLVRSRTPGMYCCGPCSVSLWRHLVVGGLEEPEKRLRDGMRSLKAHRDGEGKWRRFPFYYTLLALAEVQLPSALVEMKYAAPVAERLLKRCVLKDDYAKRRRDLLMRVVAKV